MRADGRHASHGFSLIEIVVTMALLLLTMAVVFAALHPVNGAFSLEPEAADLQQRLRVAVDTLSQDVRGAGAGFMYGPRAGPLADLLPPVMPFRQGRRQPDPPGTFRSDTLTLVSLASSPSATSLAQSLPARSASVQISRDERCPALDPSCGFRAGMQVAVVDGTGAFDMFSVIGVALDVLTLRHDMPDSAVVYLPGSTIAEATMRTYYLKADAATNSYQLMQYDGAGGADAPVVDHVVALSFELRGEPRPPQMRVAITDPSGPWTTYGPRPPPPGLQTTAYPPGENCAFVSDGSLLPPSRLMDIGAGATDLVPLTASDLTDGPWCPDALSPSRYDVDLLRVRAVAVTVRVEAASAGLRGSGALFVRPGSSPEGARFLPDQQVRFVVSPRNLRPGR